MTDEEIAALQEHLWYYSEAQRGKGWPLWRFEVNSRWETNQGFLAYAQLVALSEGKYLG